MNTIVSLNAFKSLPVEFKQQARKIIPEQLKVGGKNAETLPFIYVSMAIRMLL